MRNDNNRLTSADKIAIVGALIAVFAIVASVIEPEIRCFFGLPSDFCQKTANSTTTSPNTPPSTSSPSSPLVSPSPSPSDKPKSKSRLSNICKENRNLLILINWIVNTVFCIIYFRYVGYYDSKSPSYNRNSKYLCLYNFTTPFLAAIVNVFILCHFRDTPTFPWPSLISLLCTLVATSIYSIFIHLLYVNYERSQSQTSNSSLSVFIMLSIFFTLFGFIMHYL